MKYFQPKKYKAATTLQKNIRNRQIKLNLKERIKLKKIVEDYKDDLNYNNFLDKNKFINMLKESPEYKRLNDSQKKIIYKN
jgi:hypothetical protein